MGKTGYRLVGSTVILCIAACSGSALRKLSIDSGKTTNIAADTASESPDGLQTDEIQSNESEISGPASEPVAVAGAYLACIYPVGQIQNSAQYELDCQLSLPNTATVKVKTAKFKKVNGAITYPLTESSFDPNTLTWKLYEAPESVSILTTHSSITFDNGYVQDFSIDIATPLSITAGSNYFLSGEPNAATTGENCVELVNLDRRIISDLALPLSKPPSGPLARMNDRSCDMANFGTPPSPNRFLCKNIGVVDASHPQWMISPDSGQWNTYANKCTGDYKFSAPLSMKEVEDVIKLIDDTYPNGSGDHRVWTSINDIKKEGVFEIAPPPSVL